MRSNPSNLGNILLAFLPGRQNCHFKEGGTTTAMKEQQINNREISSKVFECIVFPPNELSTLESWFFVRTVGCGNITLSSFRGRLTTLKIFNCIQSSSPVALCAKHQYSHLETKIHHHGNWETIVYNSNRWSSGLSEMIERNKTVEPICQIERLKPLKASSRIWNVSCWYQWLYPIIIIQSVTVWLIIWWTG